jgi:hypothetical protein
MSDTMAMITGGGNPHVGFIGKPFQASVLTERVRQMLGRPAGSAARA